MSLWLRRILISARFAVGVAIVTLLAIIAYALLRDDDSESATEVARITPTTTASPTTAATPRPAATPTPPSPTPELPPEATAERSPEPSPAPTVQEPATTPTASPPDGAPLTPRSTTTPAATSATLAGGTYTGRHSGGGSVTLTVSPDGSRVEDFDLTFETGFCGLESVHVGSTGEGVQEGAWSSIAAFGSTDDGALALVVSTGRVLAIPTFAYEEPEVGVLNFSSAHVDISMSLGGSFLSTGNAEGTFAIHMEEGDSALPSADHSCDSGELTWTATAQ